MTTKAYIISMLAFAPDNTDSVDAQMIDQSIDPAVTYNPSMKLACVKAAIGVMQMLLTTADTRNRIDGTMDHQIQFDRAQVMARIKLLKGENNILDNSMPNISAPRIW